MKTEVVKAGPASRAIERAVEVLREGEPVALPTETVYGLAADALNPEAVLKIFEAKERPRFDPLIIHLPDKSWLERVVNVPTEESEVVARLAKAFWPGPFTLVLPKRDIVPDITTAGLDTVGVRISAHPVFSGVIRAFGKPLAAPSANRFGRVSPTRAEHVIYELDGTIPLVVDGGATLHGIESTIVAVRGNEVVVLRRGPIIEDQFIGLGFETTFDFRNASRVLAPGQFPSHYAPETPFRLIDDAALFRLPKGWAVGLLAWKSAPKKYAAVRHLSEEGDLREAAANLFRYIRELDSLNLDLIVAERVPDKGLGAAIMDRLRRAEGRGH